MTTYELISGHLHRNVNGKDCFCALGIYAKEKGYSIEEINDRRYNLFAEPKHSEDIRKMNEILAAYVSERGYVDDCTGVLIANDNNENGIYTTPPEKIREALRAVGIDVELIDRRGRDF